MIKIDNVRVFNFEGALRGLRNPMDSWHLADSEYGLGDDFTTADYDVAEKWVAKKYPDLKVGSPEWMDKVEEYDNWLVNNGILRTDNDKYEYAYIGPKDMALAQRMVLAGADEAKFMRQIFISMDIEAPLYWWKEKDTYKVATVTNSCSTMHKITSKPITRESFSFDEELFGMEMGIVDGDLVGEYIDGIIKFCEECRQKFIETNDKKYWRLLIQAIPEGWNQKRTWTGNYWVARSEYFARRYHKLTEWHGLCDVFENLPYGKDLITIEKKEKK